MAMTMAGELKNIVGRLTRPIAGTLKATMADESKKATFAEDIAKIADKWFTHLPLGICCHPDGSPNLMGCPLDFRPWWWRGHQMECCNKDMRIHS